VNGLEPDVGLDPAEKVPVYEGREQQTHGIQNPPDVNLADDPNHVWMKVAKMNQIYRNESLMSLGAGPRGEGLLDGVTASNAPAQRDDVLTYDKLSRMFQWLEGVSHVKSLQKTVEQPNPRTPAIVYTWEPLCDAVTNHR
jgi:hypothetical protein